MATINLLESVFNHLVLPPKLPGQRDIDVHGIEQKILERLIHACNTIRNLKDQPYSGAWASVEHSLRICLDINRGSGRLEKESMLREFLNLQPNNLLTLHIVEQNAGLLIRRHINNGVDTVIFEVLEASPTSGDVLAAQNALQWDFPGRAVEMHLDEFLNESFRESLATFLEKASMESLKRFEARSAKANTSIVESRDTTDPAVVTQMLMSLLEALGCSADVPTLRKRVRDEVNIQSAELPWRRLPFWLILRVSTQRQLYLTLGNETGRACYKFLICTVLAQLLEDSVGHLAPELTMMLKAKLCRRLAKLEMDKISVCSSTDGYKELFRSIGPTLKGIIEKATIQVELAWNKYKKTILRSVPTLPLHANEQTLRLSLPNSDNYLQNILNLPHTQRKAPASLQTAPPFDGTMGQITMFANRYSSLAASENFIETERTLVPQVVEDCQARCLKLAESFDDFFTAVGDAYDSNPEQMSAFILNLFDLWVQIDQCATKACPLLCEYAPVFSPKLLDVLQLPTFSSMERLQKIQIYLRDRHRNCKLAHRTIFSEPDGDCFAVQYMNQSPQLQFLQEQIEDASTLSREDKESEWEAACKEYDDRSSEISNKTCICSFNPNGTRNIQGCLKCWHTRCRKRMKITVHEEFLPAESNQKAVVVFELGIPPFLAVYRNVTFRICCNLGYPSKPRSSNLPAILLRDYSPLQQFNESTINGVSLASTKKSFLQTHFKELQMKVDVSDILLPLGLAFEYYDIKSGMWLKDLKKELTFQHICGMHVPRSLKASVLPSSVHPSPNINGPSSYEIMASQTKCPPDVSIHEFMGYQRLLSGNTRRWLTILVELGASNINFSAEDTMHLFNQLSMQAGPAQDEKDPLRDAHLVFRDPSFCQCLAEQIDSRLRNIATNWREIHCMEMLITISLRLYDLTSGQDRQSAANLLKAAREITLRWNSRLREEVRSATEADAAGRAANYGLWAALLCRRTFTIFAASDSKINADELSFFVQASVALQENLVIDLAKLSLNLKNMLIRDIKMGYQMQSTIKLSIETNPGSLGAAINMTWTDSGNSTGRTYYDWHFLPSPNDRWVSSIINNTTNQFVASQVVHYNFVEGHLLVDWKPLRRLPLDIRESADVKELFGNQHLLTFPSSLVGMSHVMATRNYGNQVHFGLRGKDVVIRALTRDTVLEFVPRRIFMDKDHFDLPLSLVENCVHWLNLNTKCLEIRRKPEIWKTRPNDWNIDIMNRRANRKRVSLVDPHSELCKRIARIFRHFEDPQRLTVFQPLKGKLSVEMRHLELSFFVNKNKLLQCRELHAEIDPNQDAGTLYGFQSKIVLRDVANIERRSIITSLGKLTYNRHSMHLEVRASSTNKYGRFGIDNVLGRLSCPSDPLLLYSKAQFHAFTSFVMPDPLTGRTGTEEALHTLESGCCQPWSSINKDSAAILKAIKELSPPREYYPNDQKRLQTVTWDKNLTVTVQHESYETIVNRILGKSDQLQVFSDNNHKEIDSGSGLPCHLRTRGEFRRLLYERSISHAGGIATGIETAYKPRHLLASLPQANKVFHIVKVIRKQSFSVHMRRRLADILLDWNLIGGFDHISDSDGISSSLSDLIETNIGEQWGSLVTFCRQTEDHNPYKLIFRLGLLSFGTKPDMDAIHSLAAFGCLDALKAIQPPLGLSFAGFKLNESPTLEKFLNLIAADYPAFVLDAKTCTMERDLSQKKQHDMYNTEGRRLAQFLLEQWPSSEPSSEGFKSTVVNIELSLERIIPEWQRLRGNVDLSQYVIQAQEILDRYKGTRDMIVPRAVNAKLAVFCASHCGSVIPSLSRDLLVKCGPVASKPLSPNPGLLLSKDMPSSIQAPNEQSENLYKTTSAKEVFELSKILDSFSQFPDALRRQYGNDLRTSLAALDNISNQPKLQEFPPDVNDVKKKIEQAREALKYEFERIQSAFSAGEDRFQWLRLGGLWPCTTPLTILEQLRSSSGFEFGSNMRESLVYFGILATTLQRLLRIRHAQLREDRHKLLEEFRNTGHENWAPLEFPDWLLLEIESDLLIRCEQIDVAHAIISPRSRSNTVLQMNMGKGKTSCIVPMAIAILADKKQLSRLIVPKALLFQTAQAIQSRLGGLVGREIRHIPFSRRTLTTPNMLRLYKEHHHEILRCCGVILTTPEHILSYKLSGLQRLADSRVEEGQEMVEFQSWLGEQCRDVLDESDVTLAVKTQLIYPSGLQMSVDGHPNRWEVAQILLSLVEDHLPSLQKEFPRSIEVVKRRGFPMLHFLQIDVEDALQQRIINDICDGRISSLRLAASTLPVSKHDMKRVLSDENLDHELIDRISICFAEKSSACKIIILLLRGLLSERILLLCLKKRWNVQYGLHPKRHPIAVPFEAKGVPSEQAEFGHPDVSILFTCLAFYYSGLNPSQLREGLHRVLKSDDPAAEYDRWTCSSDTLPEALHHWNVINTDDQGQLEELWHHLRLNRNVLDHYMNNFVFPVHAKQFATKLQASGWDIPLFSKSVTVEEISCAKTTGFSGTNDNKMMLPLNIRQDDLPSLCQTNAEVLTYILQNRNRQYKLAALHGKRLTEEGLLRRMKELSIRILIDAGAYILEMDNRTLVMTWLKIDTEAKGAVYFGSDNRAWVQYRGGKDAVPLVATTFTENLDECLVYFDEAHTRGIDLKLPQKARGALTLALGQTKDHTVQAAMRLRQLGSTQSIIFFAPPEVHQSILDVCKELSGETLDHSRIDSSHVITWLLEQTCRTNEHLQNLYLAQGKDFCLRTNAQWTNEKFLAVKGRRDDYLKVIQHKERCTLEELYGAAADSHSGSVDCVKFPELKSFVEELSKRREGAIGNRHLIHSSVLEEVEQEREVEFQVEEVRQVQNPKHYEALTFPGLHKAVSEFVTTGILAGSHDCEHAFEALAHTSIGQKYNVTKTASQLFVSPEFMRTVVLNNIPNDNFLRPVEWILWNPSNETALIVISEEVELVIPIIRASSKPPVHLITYAAPVTKQMVHFNALSYYALPRLPAGYKVPDWLPIELGIFAGRLYMSFQELAPLTKFLQRSDEADTDVTQSKRKLADTFARNPLNFLREWLTLCRRGQDIMCTPMGYFCQGRAVHENHPFFVARNLNDREVATPSVGGRIGGIVEEAEDCDTDFEDEWGLVDQLDY